jgi:hypothetical protein
LTESLDGRHARRRSRRFYLEHHRCGELDAGVEDDHVWMTCTCGAVIVQALEPAARAVARRSIWEMRSDGHGRIDVCGVQEAPKYGTEAPLRRHVTARGGRRYRRCPARRRAPPEKVDLKDAPPRALQALPHPVHDRDGDFWLICVIALVEALGAAAPCRDPVLG